jgi:hypothetical protein
VGRRFHVFNLSRCRCDVVLIGKGFLTMDSVLAVGVFDVVCPSGSGLRLIWLLRCLYLGNSSLGSNCAVWFHESSGFLCSLDLDYISLIYSHYYM